MPDVKTRMMNNIKESGVALSWDNGGCKGAGRREQGESLESCQLVNHPVSMQRQESTSTQREGGEYALSPKVFFIVAPDGSGRLFDMEDSFHAVSPVATKMLQQALSRDRKEAIEVLAQWYEVDANRIAKDYTVLLNNLEKQGLIFSKCSPSQSSTPRSGVFSTSLALLLRLIRYFPLRFRAWVLIALAHLMLNLWGWNKTVYAWVEAHRLLDVHSEYSRESIYSAFRIVAAWHLFPINCKERALSAWSLYTMEGISSSITIGVSLFPLASHCWCGTDDGCVSDFTDRCETFTPLLVYP